MNQPEQGSLISIIVPVYNTEKYLRECLNSIVGQSYKNLEIICVNDGSKDGSLNILKEFAERDPRIVLFSKENEGLSAARNDGLTISHGEYVIFVDSDDWIDEQACQRAISTQKQYEADVVMWPYKREYGQSSISVFPLGEKPRIWNETNSFELRCRLVGPTKQELRTPHQLDSIGTAWGKLYKRDILKNIRFVDTKKIGTEDALFNVCVFKNIHKAAYITDVFNHYRRTSADSLSNTFNIELIEKWTTLHKLMLDTIDDDETKPVLLHALGNRIACGTIGLGFGIAGLKIPVRQRVRKLKELLSSPKYSHALSNIDMQYMPVHWKFFFFCTKHRMAFTTFLLLKIMDKLRKIM